MPVAQGVDDGNTPFSPDKIKRVLQGAQFFLLISFHLTGILGDTGNKIIPFPRYFCLMENLKNKTALITGGNSGIGYATAKELKARGAQVIITGRRQDAVSQAAEELGVTGMVADQSVVEDTEKLAAGVAQRFGKIDILFINAGIVNTAPIGQTTEEMFDQLIGINFKGAISPSAS
ncbi:MAG: SDR family NAD(P)-dependent oxidoreductase [Mucilaginibacter sp.]